MSGSFFSPDESASEGDGPFTVSEPRELKFTMKPGREYTFNVGIWVSTDYSAGVGAAGVQALMEGDVHTVSLFPDE